MPIMQRSTITRTTAQLGENERIEYETGPRSTFIVMRAVLETDVHREGWWDLTVYGRRKEDPRDHTGGAYDAPREDHWSSTTRYGGLPEELHPLFAEMKDF
jgi:hypothetical protein